MSSVIEIKPTGWQNNSQGNGGAAPGNDVRSVFMDKDGVTAWLLQSVNGAFTAGSGFARIRLSDGAILFSGNWNNSFSTVLQGYHTGGVPLWFQIGSNYFVMGYSTSVLHKMVVSPSAVGSWGNSYLTDTATLNLSATIATSSTNCSGFATASVGGINYIAMVFHGTPSGNNLVVINADAMTLVGTWPFPSTFSGEALSSSLQNGVFFDKFGKIWVVSFVVPTAFPTDPNNLTHGMFLSTGDPATPSGLVTNFLPVGSLPTNFVSGAPSTYAAYNSISHSVIVGIIFSNNVNNNQAMMTVDLVSLASTGFRFSTGPSDNIDWWDSNSHGGNFSAFALGAQSDGSFSVPAGGGISLSASFSKLNPSTFAQTSSVNVVDVINSSTVADHVSAALGISGIAFSSSFIVTAFASDASGSGTGGSPVYIIPLGLCGVAAPLGNPFLK